MKKFAYILIFILSIINLKAQELEQAQRFLKLASSFIFAGETDKANANYQKAKEILSIEISKHPNDWRVKYWSAVADETLGYIYLKLGNVDLSKLSFETALKKYQTILKFQDNSPEAIKMIINKIDENGIVINNLSNSSSKIVNLDNTKKISGNFILPKNTESFSCINCNLKELPSFLLLDNNIKRIVARNNKIKQFYIPKSNKLVYLDLSNNKIKSLEGDFKDLPNLEYLDLSNNSLKTLPINILSLKNLKILNISKNQVPFSYVKTLIQGLPNTLIINNNYIIAPDENQDESGAIEGE
jgi:tetratricopeptide (TPR) repeat protein